MSKDVCSASDIDIHLSEHHLEPVSLVELGKSLSYSERRADEAERQVTSWLKCEFLMDKIGDEVEGAVVGVQNFGLFIQIDELYVEGLMHVKTLPRDYYYYEDKLQRLVGKRRGRIYLSLIHISEPTRPY